MKREIFWMNETQGSRIGMIWFHLNIEREIGGKINEQ